MKPLRVGLVLGGGGVTGSAFHRGVTTALTDWGMPASDVDILVGTSAGALSAALLRRPAADVRRLIPSQRQPKSTERLRRDFGPVRAALRHPSRARLGVATCFAPPGRRSTDAIVERVRDTHGDAWPERELLICATDRHTGLRHVFGAPDSTPTDPASAVAASIAIPSYYKPVAIHGVNYVDGGVHSPTNADVLLGRGLDLVVVSSPMSLDPGDRCLTTKDYLLRWHCYRLARREVRLLEAQGMRAVVIAPDAELVKVMGPSLMASDRASDITAAAHALAMRGLSGAGQAGDVELDLTAATNSDNKSSEMSYPGN